MSEMSERLRSARIAAGFSSAADAARALGLRPSTYSAHENGQNNFDPSDAEQYGQRFGVRAAWLLTGEEPKARWSKQLLDEPNTFGLPQPAVLERTIPVYGQAMGGDDGYFVLNGEKIGDLLAPPSLSKVRGAYAVLVSGESMEPRYFAGEAVYLNPNIPARRGDFVVAQVLEGEDPIPRAYVKQFVRMNGDELVVAQFNPAKELRFPVARVRAVHRIVFSGDGL